MKIISKSNFSFNFLNIAMVLVRLQRLKRYGMIDDVSLILSAHKKLSFKFIQVFILSDILEDIAPFVEVYPK